jgi:hypothetical protein
VKIMRMTAAAALSCFLASAALADHSYIDFDGDGNMVISGPFDVTIPKPAGARLGGPEHTTPSFMSEELKVSRAGFFGDQQFVMVDVETTKASAGPQTNKNLPLYELAGEEFRARTVCLDISQAELDADDDPIFEFIEGQSVQIVPAVNVLQLFVSNDDGTAEAKILFMRNLPGSCDAMTADFEAEFKAAFERFVEAVQKAN